MSNRLQVIGGELGGPKVSKYITASMMISLWLIYIIFSIIEAEGGSASE